MKSPSKLIKNLRLCHKDNRRKYALKLAKDKSAELIDEFIRMVERRRRFWFRHYTSDDQILGIECLGYTKQKKALDYLRRLKNSARYP